MNTVIQDLQNQNNSRNGQVFSDRESVVSLLQDLLTIESHSMCQFTGDNGVNLIVEIAHDFGCTPIDGRYRIDIDELREVVAAFVATGERSSQVAWENLA